MNIVTYQSHYFWFLNSMTHSNRFTLQIFLPLSTKQTSGLLSKLEWRKSVRSVRVQIMPKDKYVSLQESNGRQEWRSPWENDKGWADMDCCPWELMSAKIDACEDRWGDNSCCGKCRCVRRYRIPTCCHTWKHVWKTVGPCVAVLCVDMDTVHGCCNTTGLPLFCSKQACCTRSAQWSQEVEKAKTYWIGAKSNFLVNVFKLSYTTAVFLTSLWITPWL